MAPLGGVAAEEVIEDEPLEGEDLSALRFEDPTLTTLIEGTQWDYYLSPEMIKSRQQRDPVIGPVYRRLRNQPRSTDIVKKRWRKLISQGRIWLSEEDIVMIFKNKIWIPVELTETILTYFHTANYFAHQGRARMKAHITARFYWVNIGRHGSD